MEKRLHIFFSLFLLISFSWQCAAKSILFLSFKFNQKELAATVCENKEKPKSCCEAKCYLEKEIKKEEKRESDSSSPIKDKTEKSELRTGLINFVFPFRHYRNYERCLLREYEEYSNLNWFVLKL